MTPATIEYPILLHNNTISLDPEGSWTTDRVTTQWPESFILHETGTVSSKHGGLWLYFKSFHYSYALTRHTHMYNWEVEFAGAIALRYVVEDGGPGGCEMTFRDPLLDIMSDVREMAFRTALFLQNNDARLKPGHGQTIEVQQLWSQIVSKSLYIYLAIAVVITILAALCVFILLGWWKLGRQVTLSPIEVAKAFAAPSLQEARSNADINALLKTMGLSKTSLRSSLARYSSWSRLRSDLAFCPGQEGAEKPHEVQDLL